MHQVSRTTLGALKNVKFRLSRNSTKFVVVARFCEMIPTAKFVSSSEIKKKFPNFEKITFLLFFKNSDFSRFHIKHEVRLNCRKKINYFKGQRILRAWMKEVV